MKTKNLGILMVATVTLSLSAYRFGYHRGYMARGPIVHFERDTVDTAGQGSMKLECEPYFTKGNPIPTELK